MQALSRSSVTWRAGTASDLSQEAQRIGRLDQGAVHPGEQGKAEKERQAWSACPTTTTQSCKIRGTASPRCLSAEPLNSVTLSGRSGVPSGKAEDEGVAGSYVENENATRGVIWLAGTHGYLRDRPLISSQSSIRGGGRSSTCLAIASYRG
jgi:hypothetical protein